ncbi:MAG: MgtC/SapB family protein [Archangiaceae bacterium]|nr:MgtC/SapB family protein [Archangiaceae bacterium]
MEQLEPFLSYALALFSGLLIGLEREHSRAQAGSHSRFLGGVRTFPLFALAAAVSASLVPALGPWPFVLAAAATIGFTVLGRRPGERAGDENGSSGLTSEGAFLLSFMLGALSGSTEVVGSSRQKVFVVASLAVITTLLLSAKPVLHQLSSKISRDDVIATVKFLLVAVVVLPLLPDQPYGPYGVFNPWKLGVSVTLIAGVSFVGYAASRVMGSGRGLLVTGLVGGLVSSTAVTLASARRTRQVPELAEPSALSITSAWTIMMIRVVVLVAATNAELLPRLLVPFSAMAASGAAVAAVLYWRTRRADKNGHEAHLSNPFELSESLKLVAVIVAVTLLSRWAQARFGDTALYLTSLLAGLADVDAITLSVSAMAQKNQVASGVAVAAIYIAAVANTLTKQAITLVVGTRALAARVALAALAMLAAGGLAIALQVALAG